MLSRIWHAISRRLSGCHRLLSSMVAPPMTAVEKVVLDHIKATGPISVSTYMQLCLSHPTEGYYMRPSNPVFGARGDFITSPEISQVFGELVGVWLLSQWSSETRKTCGIRLVELGPGRGTLMFDILRVISHLKRAEIKQVHLVETSATMRSVQKDALSAPAQKLGCALTWHDSVESVPHDPTLYTMFIAHEFFDALPIHIVERTARGWQEVLIATAPDASDPVVSPSASPPTRLRFVLSPTPTPVSKLLVLSSRRFEQLPIGSRIEVSPTSFGVARKIAQILTNKKHSESGRGQEPETEGAGGCGLIVDYGDEKVFGGSFRAFKNHKLVDVFHRPGECDLTANVDFAYLKEAISPFTQTHGPVPQATFLEQMGLKLRVAMLARSASTEERKKAIEVAAEKLVDRAGMGSQYRVLGITAGASGMVWPFV